MGDEATIASEARVERRLIMRECGVEWLGEWVEPSEWACVRVCVKASHAWWTRVSCNGPDCAEIACMRQGGCEALRLRPSLMAGCMDSASRREGESDPGMSSSRSDRGKGFGALPRGV